MRFAVWIVVLAGCGKDSPPPQATSSRPTRQLRIVDLSSQPPALLAIRDDGAAWRRIARTGRSYETAVTGPRFSILSVCEHDPAPFVELRDVTVDDAFELAIDCPTAERVDVDVQWAPDEPLQLLDFKDSIYPCKPEKPCAVERTTSDALVVHGADGNLRGQFLRSLAIEPGVTIAADASQGWPLEPGTLEVTFDPPGPQPIDRYYTIQLCFETAMRLGNLCSLPYGDVVAGTPLHVAYQRPPLSAWRETDCHRFSMWGVDECIRPGQPTVHVNLRPHARGTYDRATRTVTWSDDPDAIEIHLRTYPSGWRILATRGWLDGARRYTIPSLRDVPGWSRAWEPTSARVDVDMRWSKTAPLGAALNHDHTLWSPMRTGDRVERAGVFVDPDAY